MNMLLILWGTVPASCTSLGGACSHPLCSHSSISLGLQVYLCPSVFLLWQGHWASERPLEPAYTCCWAMNSKSRAGPLAGCFLVLQRA